MNGWLLVLFLRLESVFNEWNTWVPIKGAHLAFLQHDVPLLIKQGQSDQKGIDQEVGSAA